MEIIKDITNINFTKANNRTIKYIVIHYVGAVSSAKNNAIYFKNVNRQSSAHYFVDDNETIQVVENKDIAWHCGSNKYYCDCRNSNSIGIEMCCIKKNGKLDVSDNVVNKTIELTKELMKKYNIDLTHIIRHYDISHKVCPAPFVNDISRWTAFKKALGEQAKPSKPSTSTKYITGQKVLEWQKTINKVYGEKLALDSTFGTDCEKKALKHCLYYKKPIIKNDYVLLIQKLFNEKGYKVSKDKMFGPDCKAKTLQFQKDNKITQDGCVGPAVVKLLLK